MASKKYVLELRISSDKKEYKVGDTIKFKFVLKNAGKEPFYIFPRGDPYTHGWFKIVDEDGKDSEILRIVEVELDLSWPEKDDFILLKPGRSHDIEIEGHIKSGLDVCEEHHEGLFLDFANSAIRLKGPGKFRIYGQYINLIDHYSTYSPSRDDVKEWPINAWTGDLLSELITIDIDG